MFETKKVTLEDNGTQKIFSIKPLPARAAMKLIRRVAVLMADTQLIQSVVMQQFVQNILKSGEQIEGVDIAELQRLTEMDLPTIVTSLVQSIIYGLDDNAIDDLIDSCLSSVVYHNGTDLRPANEALDLDMIADFTVVIALIKEVFLLNFSGAIERAKKLLSTTNNQESSNS